MLNPIFHNCLNRLWFWDTLSTKSKISVQIRIQHAQISIGIKFDPIIFTYSVKNEATMLNKSWGHFFGDTLYIQPLSGT